MEDYVLSNKQKKIIGKLGFLRRYGFYLAGGTALALQLGHRRSQDLDFYTPKHFQSKNLLNKLEEVIRSKATRYSLASNMLFIRILGVDLSFVWYEYPLIKPKVKMDSIDLASKEDIGGMKILAIIQRATKRDYIDTYFLIKEFGLEKLLGFAKAKYTEFNPYLALRALRYFVDVEKRKEKRGRLCIYSRITWPEIKEFLAQVVKKYQLAMFRKRKG